VLRDRRPAEGAVLDPPLSASQQYSRHRRRRAQLERVPHFGEDAFRAVAGLPGVSTDDFSSKLHVRGGSGNDLRITLDGVELIDPRHLRAVGEMFSLVRLGYPT
jgi:hypothetical protein